MIDVTSCGNRDRRVGRRTMERTNEYVALAEHLVEDFYKRQNAEIGRAHV